MPKQIIATPIQLATEIAIPAKVADQLQVTALTLSAPSPNAPIRAIAVVAPLVSDTGEVVVELQKSVAITDLEAASATVPELLDAMNAINTAIQAYVNANGLFSQVATKLPPVLVK